ncbi:type II CAAX prenyl endopeptidase Rce1 family protein [Microbacterium sp.]|uniref:CPBP family glutamic-type intramembrane protease n=1 Tax=Microbacterium sp. TaxID=51671 RepID=UPI0039E626F8
MPSAAHYAGAPSGLVGVTLATLFGAGAGLLALWSRSLLPGMLAHMIADIAIIGSLAK